MSAPDTLRAALADRYQIERELGQGGMATVYLAQDLRHDRPVAIKVLEKPAGAGIGDERFQREISTAARLSHPHILSLHDSGVANGYRYYVMPYVTGESLRDRIGRERTLPVSEAVRIVGEVADALDYAHRAGIVHRDIKPENIMLHEGHAVVMDFGIALAQLADETGGLTATGMIIGTPAYLSPEQATGEELDGRSDLYSLGCVLFECLAGTPPFTGSTAALLTQRLLNAAPSVRERRADVSEGIARALQRVLAIDRGARFPTGQAFSAALKGPQPSRAAPDRHAIVVLPFANLSPDPDNEYFSDGLTEEIIADLSKVKALSVISRTSAMQLKGTAKGVRTIGRELGVRYVLEGSVRKAGNNLRITAQLIDAANDDHLWAEKYGGTMDDVFELQERVAREIVKALGITLTSDEDRRLAHRSIENAHAFELYLQARQEVRRYAAGSIDRGEALVRRAMEIEGETPPLQALLAWAQVTRVRAGLVADRSSLDASAAIANALLVSAPDAPYGHAILGLISYERGLLADAVGHLLAALEREPNDADTIFYLGISYVGAGQVDKMAPVAATLMKLDPLSQLAWLMTGIATWWTGRAGEGMPSLVRAAEMDPTNLIARWTLGYAYALVGDVQAAWKEAEYMQQQAPTMPYTIQLVALVHGMEGRSDAARAVLGGVTGLDSHHKFHLAESYAMAGDSERALELLEDAVSHGFHPGEFIAYHCPFLAPLRGTPRFEAVAAQAQRLTAEFPK
ncbi:MAG TPA: protein kinase [Gemmatimonadales bacterium]|nr:protein kinase [Gemmatimonadales bacterium]